MSITTTARSTPIGTMLGDGFSTKICFTADPDVSFWEKTVQPPGIDGGDKVNNTTMFNTTYRTYHARYLKEMTDSKVMVAYDPRVYPQIVALINVATSITVYFPNGGKLAFYGYLKSFEFSENSEGNQPEATATIVCTNTNPSTGAEAGPEYTSENGTAL